LDIVDWVQHSGQIATPSDAAVIVQTLTKYMLAVEIDAERADFFLNQIFLDGLPATTWTSEWSLYGSSGDDTVVRERLETLVASLMQTPEYQLI
jgi:hypothetical protein